MKHTDESFINNSTFGFLGDLEVITMTNYTDTSHVWAPDDTILNVSDGTAGKWSTDSVQMMTPKLFNVGKLSISHVQTLTFAQKCVVLKLHFSSMGISHRQDFKKSNAGVTDADQTATNCNI